MGRLIAVLDRKQAIYGFRGANSSAANELETRFKCKLLPLSVSYRCPVAVVLKARELGVPQIEWAEGAQDGYVGEEGTDWKGQAECALGAPIQSSSSARRAADGHSPMGEGIPASPLPEGISKWTGLGDFSSGDAILCRLTRPLVEVAFALVRARIPCRMMGRDIGKGLIALIERVARKQRQQPLAGDAGFEVALDEYLGKQRLKLSQKKKWPELGRLEDQVATIRVFIEGGSHVEDHGNDNRGAVGVDAPETVGELIEQVERLFTDNGDRTRTVTLSTIHRAKGLEFVRVFVLHAEWMWARQDWELQAERNLAYVACTRAIRELRYITSKDLGLGEDL